MAEITVLLGAYRSSGANDLNRTLHRELAADLIELGWSYSTEQMEQGEPFFVVTGHDEELDAEVQKLLVRYQQPSAVLKQAGRVFLLPQKGVKRPLLLSQAATNSELYLKSREGIDFPAPWWLRKIGIS